MNPTDPNSVPPLDSTDPSAQKPWKKPPEPQQQTDNGTVIADGGGVVEAGVEGASLGADIVSGAADIAGGAIEVVGNVAAGAIEGAGEVAGAAIEGAGGCADGCGGCSLALLITLFAAAGTAMAFFR